MILKDEILSLATTLQLQPTTIEKDYVLSWVLYGISQNSKLSEWFFKGGTCLKKCYFETYRFSEDLDFTVPMGAIYNVDEIKNALDAVAEFVLEKSGINLKTKEIEVNESINKKGRKTYVAKYTYLGPLNLPSRTHQRIKFDITDDELIVDSSDIRDVFHLYSDAPAVPAKIRCYSVNEILSEKTRAIYERQGRARDIYDIVNISRSFREYVDPHIARRGLKEKFAFKSLPPPSADLILSQVDLSQLKTSWKEQLNHQVEVLPPVESFYDDLKPALLWWIDENQIESTPALISTKKDEISLPRVHFPEPTIAQARKIGFGRAINITSTRFMDQIRYAARNRLLIEIDYHGFKRLVEPYSLRKPKTGNHLLYVYELTKGSAKINSTKAYKINEIKNVEVKEQAFSTRFSVEL